MAYSGDSVNKVYVRCKLYNGSTGSGAIKTLSVSIGSLDRFAYASSPTDFKTKAFAMCEALSVIFDRTLSSIDMQVNSTLSGDD